MTYVRLVMDSVTDCKPMQLNKLGVSTIWTAKHAVFFRMHFTYQKHTQLHADYNQIITLEVIQLP